MLNDKFISSLNKILSKVETVEDVKALYNALEPLRFKLPYYTEWVDKKINSIWSRANKNNIEKVASIEKETAWKKAANNFKTFEHMAVEYFTANGTKEQRILQLIQKLVDKNWKQGKDANLAIEKAVAKNWCVKASEVESRVSCCVIDLTKPFKLRGMTNSMEIEELQRLLGVEVAELPYFGEWSVRDKAGDYANYTIFLNGNIVLKNESFHAALVPYMETWISQQWQTICYKK